MAAQSNDGYILGRTFASSSRLNLSHFLWKHILGYTVHPNIPTSGFRRIADVATGTAIWPLDVGSEFPSAEVDAFDIALDQCPPTLTHAQGARQGTRAQERAGIQAAGQGCALPISRLADHGLRTGC